MPIFKYLHLCNDIILRLVLIFMSRFVTYKKENRKPPVMLSYTLSSLLPTTDEYTYQNYMTSGNVHIWDNRLLTPETE